MYTQEFAAKSEYSGRLRGACKEYAASQPAYLHVTSAQAGVDLCKRRGDGRDHRQDTDLAWRANRSASSMGDGAGDGVMSGAMTLYMTLHQKGGRVGVQRHRVQRAS